MNCNDHCLCSESRDVRRQVRWGGCSTGIVSCMSGKAMDRFQYIWIAMIGEIYRLIAEYLGNGFRREPANYIENVLANQNSFCAICAISPIFWIVSIPTIQS